MMEFERRLGDDASVRRLEEADATELFAVVELNRSHLRQWLPWLDATGNVSDVRAFIRAGLERAAARLGLECGIWHEGGLAGAIGYPSIDEREPSGTIGYWVAESAQGHGLATRSARALVDHGFEVLGLARLEIRCAVDNVRSRRVPERLGFELDVILPRAETLYGREMDMAVYSVLRNEWPRSPRR